MNTAATASPIPPSASLAEITSNDTLLFTCGACHILAREINKLTGWPIHCFLDGPDSPAPSHHAFVIPRRGWRLDVDGFSHAAEHNAKWGGCAASPGRRVRNKRFSYGKIIAAWGGSANWFDETSNEIIHRAQEIAPALVDLAVKTAETDSGGSLKVCKVPGRSCRDRVSRSS